MKWLDFLGKYYKEQKKANPDYKYKQAMKDAVKPYKKQLSGGGDKEDAAAVAAAALLQRSSFNFPLC
mgnify:CR=1 FL=1